jgi:X-Pro dipeptidyl-peptidase
MLHNPIMMKYHLAFFLSLFPLQSTLAQSLLLSEVVYVESPTDTDSDGKPDRIYVSITRPSTQNKLSSIYEISPYSLGGTDAPNHGVDVDLLPQDEEILPRAPRELRDLLLTFKHSYLVPPKTNLLNASRYAQVSAHSLGTGRSTGCATVGDRSETLAAKSVIDWLNGRARAFSENGTEARATWSNGKVAMTGTSYNGTLPIMVATTGVEGLKAIIPIAAISNWYDYYRSNGLVVNPGGYIGEDADVLGQFIMRKNDCRAQLEFITRNMARETGDFTPFWQERNYLPEVKNIKAATFIIHGQADWNVKQKNAIQLWEALEGGAPRRMFLHNGGHGSTSRHGVPQKTQAWFDHFLEGDENGITNGPQVEVELPDGTLLSQEAWPQEKTSEQTFYFSSQSSLSKTIPGEEQLRIIDDGKTQKLESKVTDPQKKDQGRLVFLTTVFSQKTLLSGTSQMHLQFSLNNRRAANLSVVLVEYDSRGRGTIITRGWADPQNYRDLTHGEVLIPGKLYEMNFPLEPKQYMIASGNRIGVIIASTDYNYTLRPRAGTEMDIHLGAESFIQLNLSSNL